MSDRVIRAGLLCALAVFVCVGGDSIPWSRLLFAIYVGDQIIGLRFS